VSASFGLLVVAVGNGGASNINKQWVGETGVGE